MEPLLPTFSDPDVQNALPTLQVSLSRVGVTGVEKVVRIRDDDGREDLFSARNEDSPRITSPIASLTTSSKRDMWAPF